MTPLDDWPCLAENAGGCLLRVVVTPNAPRTAADGLHDGCLRVRLNAPPVDGKANAALQAWLAAELRLPKRAVNLLHGQTARRKQWALDAPVHTVRAWLQQHSGVPAGVGGGTGAEPSFDSAPSHRADKLRKPGSKAS